MAEAPIALDRVMAAQAASWNGINYHRDAVLESLREFPPYQELMRPR